MKFAESPVLAQRLPVWRSRFVVLAIMAGFGALLGRSVYLQGFQKDFLQQKGESRYLRDLDLPATRGRITDRNGDVLAMSTPMQSVWAIPEDASLTPQQERELAKLLGMDVSELRRRLNPGKGGDFAFIKRQVEPEAAARVAALKLPGIHQSREYRRYYPVGEVVAHLVGFAGVDDKGLEGVELAFQGQLIGKPGSRRVIKDRRGQIVEGVASIKAPKDGRDIVLAVDGKLQYLAYSNLRQAMREHQAKAGSIVVVDARNGEILALANFPTYNPNNRLNLSGAQIRNRAVTDSFEPGSTMKPFTAALALDRGKVGVDTVIQTAPGKLTIGNATISDSHPHGALTVAQVIQKSSNVGIAKMAAAFTPRELWAMYDELGFGQPPRLGFPGEIGGRLRPYKTWQPIEQATMSYGHGISVSLMQLARAYTVFARDGELLPLSLQKLEKQEAVHGRKIFSPQTMRELRAMLEMAVQPGGTAPRAQVPGYRVAGKTGTAHKLAGGAYVNRYISSFVGFAPASDPRLIVAVMIDEPSGGKHYGGEVAAPVFSSVMGGALRQLGVAPDAPPPGMQVARTANDSGEGKTGESL